MNTIVFKARAFFSTIKANFLNLLQERD